MLWGISLAIFGTLTLTILLVHHHEPTQFYNRGMDYFEKGDYEKARTFFERGMESFPLSPIIDQTAFHFAITYFKEEKWDNALESLEKMAVDYPESRRLPEVLYHMGLCYLKLERHKRAIQAFRQVIKESPEESWAEHSRERLKELGQQTQ